MRGWRHEEGRQKNKGQKHRGGELVKILVFCPPFFCPFIACSHPQTPCSIQWEIGRMSKDDGLPKGWARARIADLVGLINGCAFNPTDWRGTGISIFRIQNLNNPDAPFNYYPADELPEKFLIDTGDLLFAWSGTPGTSFGAHIWRGGLAWLNQHIFHVVFCRDHLDPRFLQLAINKNLDDYIRAAHGGAGLAHITKGRFESSELLVAPLSEQRRIVAKIEELFSDLDAGVAALKRAKANLKRYRAAVLKAAVEGKLVPQDPTDEPANVLLERIHAARHASRSSHRSRATQRSM
jgi:type I restriction enzyme, S subunit